MNILLIEDAPAMALEIKQWLEQRGHDVIWIIGATELGDTRIVGIRGNPNAAEPMQDVWNGDVDRLVEIDLSGIDFAMSDAGLVGPVNRGQSIVPVLKANGIVTCGIATVVNNQLIACGASMGTPKHYAMLAMEGGYLDPGSALADPAGCAAALELFNQRTAAEFEQARVQKRRPRTGFVYLDNHP
jgi:hypothetical protein